MRDLRAKNKNAIKEGSMIGTIIIYIFAAFICFITIYPMYYVLILSLSEPAIAATMKVYVIPKGFYLDTYRIIAGDMRMWRAYANTLLYVSTTTVLMILTSVLAAYPLTSKKLLGRKYINMFLLIPMFIGGGMIPSFLLISKLNLYGSPLALIIPSCFSIWNIILVKSYFGTIPETIREAARIDGANSYQMLFQIFVPTAKPILAVIAVYTIISVWNSWFNAMVYLPSETWQPLQMYLRRVLVEQTVNLRTELSIEATVAAMKKQLSNMQLKYAMIIFTTLPVLFAYPFFQKYFVKGVMLGSLKE